MKSLAVLFTCFLFTGMSVTAQVKVKDGNQIFYNRIVWTGSTKLMTSEQLLAAPTEKLPVGFLDTLKKYDWYELCNYSFFEKKLTSSFEGLDTTKSDALSRQFNFFSISATGLVNRNYLQKTTSNQFAYYTVTFDTVTATRVKSVSEIKGSTYLVQENYGELEHLKIISYKNDVMILETTRFGKPGEKPVMFRSAYFGVVKN